MTDTSRQRLLLAWAVLTVAVACAFRWAPAAGFLGDDFGYVQRFAAMPLPSWPRLFLREWSEGLWDVPLRELRPVSALAFMVDARIWGGAASGYHVTNLLLHIVCSGLVMLMAGQVLNNRWGWPAVACGLIFALHPVHLEPVVWITGRPDLLAALGFLLAFYALLRFREEGAATGWLVAAWLAFGAGIFAKEFCLTLPIVAVLYELTGATRRDTLRRMLMPYAGWAVLAVVYYACRSYALGPDLGAPPLDVMTKAFWRSVAQREFIYLGELVWPIAAWLPVADSARPQALRLLLTVMALLLAGVGAIWWRDRRAGARDARALLGFLVIWMALTTLPFVVTYVSARHLYLASAGFIVGMTVLLVRLLPGRVPFSLAAAVIIAACVVRLETSAGRWREAAALSAAIGDAVGQVAVQSRPGDVLLLDVPGTRDGAWVWSWASPFALRPPFQPRPADAGLIVLEREDVFYHPEAWAEHPSLPRVRGAAGGGWLITAVDTRVETLSISAEALMAAVRSDDVALGAPGSFGRLVEAVRRSARPAAPAGAAS